MTANEGLQPVSLDICIECCKAVNELNFWTGTQHTGRCKEDGCEFQDCGGFACRTGLNFRQGLPPESHVDGNGDVSAYACNSDGTIREYLDTAAPTLFPTTASPTLFPTDSPTQFPTTKSPTSFPTKSPTQAPTLVPTPFLTGIDTESPSKPPTPNPTNNPSRSPTELPTVSPTQFPVTLPPSPNPTKNPFSGPTEIPTASPTQFPTTLTPTAAPVPTTSPTFEPTFAPINGTIFPGGGEGRENFFESSLAVLVALGLAVCLLICCLICVSCLFADVMDKRRREQKHVVYEKKQKSKLNKKQMKKKLKANKRMLQQVDEKKHPTGIKVAAALRNATWVKKNPFKLNGDVEITKKEDKNGSRASMSIPIPPIYEDPERNRNRKDKSKSFSMTAFNSSSSSKGKDIGFDIANSHASFKINGDMVFNEALTDELWAFQREQEIEQQRRRQKNSDAGGRVTTITGGSTTDEETDLGTGVSLGGTETDLDI